MSKYYEVLVSQTCKAIGSKDGYYLWNKETSKFQSVKEIKDFLKEKYGKCKKEKIYNDGITGEAKHVGYIYSYKTDKVSYNDSKKYNQDWITVCEIRSTPIII